MADAINRTILPRRLEVRLPDGVRVTLFLRNRRLHRMERNAPSTAPWNTALSPSDCDGVAGALQATCPAGTIATFHIAKAQSDDPFDGLVAIAEAAPAQVEASFAMAGDEIAPLTGSEATIDALLPEITDLFIEITEDAFSLAGALETDGTLVVPRAGSSSGCHLIVGRVGMLGLLVLRDTTPGAALALWAETPA
jgi:hypothetical protein